MKALLISITALTGPRKVDFRVPHGHALRNRGTTQLTQCLSVRGTLRQALRLLALHMQWVAFASKAWDSAGRQSLLVISKTLGLSPYFRLEQYDIPFDCVTALLARVGAVRH